jgi:hypothetical protein
VTKSCSICGEQKPVTEFSKLSKLNVDGSAKYHCWCRPCANEYNKVKNAEWRSKQGIKPRVRPKGYLSDIELTREMIVSKAQGKLTREATKMLQIMAKKIITKFQYHYAGDKEDCLQEAYYQVFKNWYQFDPEKGDKAFPYFTEIVKRGLAQGWKKVNMYRKDHLSIERHWGDEEKTMNI